MGEMRAEAIATFDITFADMRLALSVAQHQHRLDIIEDLKVSFLLWERQYRRMLDRRASDEKLLAAAYAFAAFEKALMDNLNLNSDEELL